jgi:hypothetical protein
VTADRHTVGVTAPPTPRTSVVEVAGRRADGASASATTSWRHAIVGASVIWVAIRIVLTAYAMIVTSIGRGFPVAPAVPQSFFTLFYHWDSSYFLEIARSGYFAPGQSADLPAFLPGYPLAGRIATTILFPGAAPSVAQVLVGLWVAAAIPSLVAGIGLWRLTAERFGTRVASGAVVLLLAGPYAVFLAASYSESLFLAFAVFAWYQARRGRWPAAVILAAAASTTRIDGVFLAAALAVLYAQSGGSMWCRPERLLRAACVFAGSITGLLGYFAFLFVRTGDPLAWLTAEHRGWDRRFTAPWTSGYATLQVALDRAASPNLRAQSLLEVLFALACIAGLVVLARRGRWGAVVLVALTLASLMTSTTYLSLARESLVLFPITMVIASYRDVPGRRWIFHAGLAVGILLFFFNAHQFVLGLWAE